MSQRSAEIRLDTGELHRRLETLVYRVLSVRRSVQAPAQALAAHEGPDQYRFLRAVELIRNTSDELAFNFVMFAPPALSLLADEDWDEWVLYIMSRYDHGGVLSAIVAMQKVPEYVESVSGARFRVRFEDIARRLDPFVLGLNGRPLKLATAEHSYTDTGTLYLPVAVGRFRDRDRNARLYKTTAVHLWAQTWFGTWRRSVSEAVGRFPEPERALARFHALETLRLDACIGRELPGIRREMRGLCEDLDLPALPPGAWSDAARRLREPDATVEDSHALLARCYGVTEFPAPVPYQGRLVPDRAEQTLAARKTQDRQVLARVLADLKEQLPGGARPLASEDGDVERPFRVHKTPEPDGPDGFRFELTLHGEPIPPLADVRQLLDSIGQDLGQIPDDYLVPAGPGGYRPGDSGAGRDAGTDAGGGAHRYDEWDFMRRQYRTDWCLLRERDVHPLWDDFVARTRRKYMGLLKHLRRTFEAVRGQDRLLRRQPDGDDVDLDAVVQAYADRQAGFEGRDALFVKRRRVDRDIAVLFLVDMSGSTKGWVNELEREALVLLCEALETLGDRYGIYGFSGFTHRRCELFRIKRIDEAYSDEVRARIGGIQPKDYTRMGVAIRHLTRRFQEIDARTRLLITLSDGRPDDQDGYRGAYGIEDTRQALFEARHQGVHPFCITIDDEAMDYLPHMFGAANFTVISDVRKLPYRVSDIYRRITG
ncbi:MAG: hypothetical protein B7Z66_12355 [Chromatiales bacterium 21-64-14]|nr:MAG: hypothetical protein B7Z66_12355 [Chromatiales bacterium 21-64-14]